MPRLSPIRGRIDSRYAEYLGLSAVLIVAAALRLWDLGQMGFGTQYYAAGVLSMLQNWHNFFFNSFDPAGFVSIDKPPLAFWIQVASAKLLGFGGFSIHLPQALEGVALIGMLYYLVRRRFGIAAGLLAAFFAAIMPISVAVDRSNNTDSCLAMLLVAAAWALSLATERNNYRMLLLAMAVLGIAFNVKMLAALVVVPGFMLVYWLGTSLGVTRKVMHLLASFAVLMAVSLVWCALYDLTPAPLRPYAGSTADNSMLELIVGENGARRFARGVGLGGRGGFVQNAPQSTAFNPAGMGGPGLGGRAGAPRGGRGGRGRGGRGRGGRGFNLAGGPGFGGGRGGDNVRVGPFRLLDPMLADQTGWLYPLALLGVAAGLLRKRVSLPLDPRQSAVLLWAGWGIVYGAVLSFAGGIFHAYYIDAMVPAICALAAIGLTQAWDWRRRAGWRAIVLPISLLLVVAWQFYISFGYLLLLPGNLQAGIAALASPNALQAWIGAVCLAGALAGIGIVLLARKLTGGPWSYCASTIAVTLGLLAISLTPITWALGSMRSGVGNSPSAVPLRLAAAGGARIAGAARNNGNENARLIAFLLARYPAQGFLLATLSSQQAAPIIIATGKPVMAMGGFAGSDPILTLQHLSELVEQKQLRFVLLGNGPGTGGRGGNVQAPLIVWIRQHGTIVDPSLWQSAQVGQNRPLRRFGQAGAMRGARLRRPGGFGGAGAMQLIDLRPDDRGANTQRQGP